MNNNILFICPKVAGFYNSIMQELEKRGYNVDYIFDQPNTNDPDFVHSKCYNGGEDAKKAILEEYKQYWTQLLSSKDYNKVYDLLLVVDGKMLHPCLFSLLKDKNPNVRFINYLFDTSRGNYNFHKNAHFFDRVFSFDKQDCSEYKYEFLPIPWVQPNEQCNDSNVVDLFGMGTYDPERYRIYTFMEGIANDNGYSSFIKLYMAPIEHYPIKYLIGTLFRVKKYLSPFVYYSSTIVHKKIPSEVFIQKMNNSKVIVDSINPYQDGLTARCTWALGAEKKIITNNANILDYEFYDPEQIFVIKDYSEITRRELKAFVESDFTMKESNRQLINKFRLDNWLDIVLS